jgi:hypothetical protein
MNGRVEAAEVNSTGWTDGPLVGTVGLTDDPLEQDRDGVRNRMLVSLRGGGGELGNLKTKPMTSLNLHKDKLEHTI